MTRDLITTNEICGKSPNYRSAQERAINQKFSAGRKYQNWRFLGALGSFSSSDLGCSRERARSPAICITMRAGNMSFRGRAAVALWAPINQHSCSSGSIIPIPILTPCLASRPIAFSDLRISARLQPRVSSPLFFCACTCACAYHAPLSLARDRAHAPFFTPSFSPSSRALRSVKGEAY